MEAGVSPSDGPRSRDQDAGTEERPLKEDLFVYELKAYSSANRTTNKVFYGELEMKRCITCHGG